MSLDDAFHYIDEHRDDFVQDLIRLCRQPSISATQSGITESAGLVQNMMAEVGLETELLEKPGANPVVAGRVMPQVEAATLGFYNHYDTVPPEPLEAWQDPPFVPTVRQGRIFSRGVADNKGNLVARLKALEAIQETMGKPSTNIKFVVEGEEEIMSPNLDAFVREHRDSFKADGYIWESGRVDEKGRPIITLGVKGILSVEMEVIGPNRDEHSGYAPLIPNPAWRIVWALSTIKNRNEKIMIEGWYDDVRALTNEEIELVRNRPFEEDLFRKRLGLKRFLGGVTGSEAVKKLAFDTTSNIHGLDAGYKVRGGHYSVIPSVALAKLDFRLVESQKPEAMFKLLKRHLTQRGFDDIKLRKLASYGPAMTSPKDPLVRLVADIARELYEKEPILNPPPGGSSPISILRKWIGKVPCVSIGVEYPGSNTHSANENIRVDDFIRGIKHIAAIITSFG